MKPHGFVVYLSPELYVAVVKLQADKGLGRVYPVLYTINEGLYKLGYITKDLVNLLGLESLRESESRKTQNETVNKHIEELETLLSLKE